MASEQGYTNQKKKGRSQFKTIHPVNNNAYGESVVPKYLADISPSSIVNIDTITDILGSNGQVEYWQIECVSDHLAVAGDIFRLKTVSDPSLFNFEFDIISVPNSFTILVLPISDVKPSSGDGAYVKRWVTAASDDEGNPQIAIAPAPVKFLLDGSTVDVSKDTATPANDIPLPVEDLIAQASLASIEADATTLAAVDFATETTLSSLEGKDFATETTLSDINAKLAGSLAPVEHDEVVLAYVGTSTDINTVTYKLASTTVATLTLSYDGSNRLVGVVRT